MLRVRSRIDTRVSAALLTRRAPNRATRAVDATCARRALVAAASAIVDIGAQVDAAFAAQHVRRLAVGATTTREAVLASVTQGAASPAVVSVRRYVRADTIAHELMLRTPECSLRQIAPACPERKPHHRTQ